jgi:O-antigen chain-terminating methyltransferase
MELEQKTAWDAVDVDALMAEVRRRVGERLASGFYAPGEVEAVRRMELSVKEKKDFGPDLEEGIAWLHANWDPNLPVPITSHRPLAGRLLVPLKKAARKLLRPFGRLILMKQMEYNGQVARLLTSALHHNQGLSQNVESRFQDLILKYVEMEKHQRELHRTIQGLETELARVRARAAAPRPAAPPVSASAAGPAPAPGEVAAPPPAAGEGAVGSYLAFEERFRGASEKIRESQRDYVPRFAAGGRILDAGCGRGEFLELLAEAGLEGYGVDRDPGMVALCREKGLAVEEGDVLGHLASLPDASLGGIFAAQVVEHLVPADLSRLVALAAAKLRPGGVFLAETINPTCLATFAGAFYLDPTHTRPVHPEALRFQLEEAGFATVEILWRSPFPPEARLKEVDLFHRLQTFEDALLNVVNDNANQLNALIYGHQDYAAVGVR